MKIFIGIVSALLISACGCSSMGTGIVGDWENNDTFSNGQVKAKQKTEMKFRPNGTMRQITEIKAGKVETKITMTGRYTLANSTIDVKAESMVLEGNYTDRKDLMIGMMPDQKNIKIPYTLKFGTLTTETKGKKMAFRRAK